MRSTGEVMGIAPTFEEAFLKGQWGAGQKLPEGGKVFLSVNDRDKRFVAEVARQYVDLGFELLATSGTAGLLAGQGIPSTRVLKVYEGRPNIVDLIKNGEVSLVINTASGKRTTPRPSGRLRSITACRTAPRCPARRPLPAPSVRPGPPKCA